MIRDALRSLAPRRSGESGVHSRSSGHSYDRDVQRFDSGPSTRRPSSNRFDNARSAIKRSFEPIVESQDVSSSYNSTSSSAPGEGPLNEDDVCPVCNLMFNVHMTEEEREEHINSCLTTSQFSGSPDRLRANRMIIYRLGGKEAEGLEECVICFEDFKAGDSVGRLECLCVYHEKCILDWFARKGAGKCPVHAVNNWVTSSAPNLKCMLMFYGGFQPANLTTLLSTTRKYTPLFCYPVFFFFFPFEAIASVPSFNDFLFHLSNAMCYWVYLFSCLVMCAYYILLWLYELFVFSWIKNILFFLTSCSKN